MTHNLTVSHRKKLEVERAHIQQELVHLREALKSEVDVEIAEADPELVEQKVVMTLIREQERKLKEIDYALQQVQHGVYGICERCGKPIDPERLEIVPETTFCMQCKMIVERETQRRYITTAWSYLDDSGDIAQ